MKLPFTRRRTAVAEEEAGKWMAEKSKEFVQKGAEVYAHD